MIRSRRSSHGRRSSATCSRASTPACARAPPPPPTRRRPPNLPRTTTWQSRATRGRGCGRSSSAISRGRSCASKANCSHRPPTPRGHKIWRSTRPDTRPMSCCRSSAHASPGAFRLRHRPTATGRFHHRRLDQSKPQRTVASVSCVGLRRSLASAATQVPWRRLLRTAARRRGLTARTRHHRGSRKATPPLVATARTWWRGTHGSQYSWRSRRCSRSRLRSSAPSSAPTSTRGSSSASCSAPTRAAPGPVCASRSTARPTVARTAPCSPCRRPSASSRSPTTTVTRTLAAAAGRPTTRCSTSASPLSWTCSPVAATVLAAAAGATSRPQTTTCPSFGASSPPPRRRTPSRAATPRQRSKLPRSRPRRRRRGLPATPASGRATASERAQATTRPRAPSTGRRPILDA
mmetsp:Transcript_38696/g.119605  ORF Transcript_38696/g.119605 Transcript_38696/m.119605 type:complete len:406 (+) Transcript_38696:269-1486(+)